MNKEDHKNNSSFKLVTMLKILKQLREKMINDFINNEPDIFLPSYRYEKSKVQLNMAIEKYFLTHINYHLTFFEENQEITPYKEQLREMYLSTYKILINKIKSTIKSENTDSSFLNDILSQEIKYLDGLLQIGDRADRNLNSLLLENERNKVIYDRKIKELKGGNSGI